MVDYEVQDGEHKGHLSYSGRIDCQVCQILDSHEELEVLLGGGAEVALVEADLEVAIVNTLDRLPRHNSTGHIIEAEEAVSKVDGRNLGTCEHRDDVQDRSREPPIVSKIYFDSVTVPRPLDDVMDKGRSVLAVTEFQPV